MKKRGATMGIINKEEFFYGNLKKTDYFERWHVYLVDASKQHMLSIVLGVLLQGKEKYAFIQIGSNIPHLNRIVKYPIEAFSYTSDSITIENNVLSRDYIQLDLDEEKFQLNGKIIFSQGKQLETKFWRPGLMGPIKWLPFLNSYHEVLSLTHIIMGEINFNNKEISFDEGRGALDKDWGKSFPNVWFWMQCNHFQKHDAAMMVGVARMPIFLNYYTAFAMPFYFNDKTEIYANYTGAHIAKLYRYKGYIHLIITEKSKVIALKVFGKEDVPLIASPMGHLIRDVYECIDSKIEVKVTQGGRTVFEDIGECAHLKIGGNTSKLK